MLRTFPILVHEALNGQPLHAEAHLTDEMLESLVHAINVGDPKEWMRVIMTGNEGLAQESLPEGFNNLFARLDSRREELDVHLNTMTRLANEGDVNNSDHRTEYQIAERTVMRIVIESVSDLLDEPEKTLLALALRGAKFFEPDLKDKASETTQSEFKRVRLENDTYAVASGEIEVPTAEQIERLKTIILPDDCLSTGMTQVALLEKLLSVGYRPNKVIMMFTVGTTAGIDHMYKEINNLKEKYGIEFDFYLQVGGLCYEVDQRMYLVHDENGEKKAKVGDMGAWNQSVEN